MQLSRAEHSVPEQLSGQLPGPTVWRRCCCRSCGKSCRKSCVKSCRTSCRTFCRTSCFKRSMAASARREYLRLRYFQYSLRPGTSSTEVARKRAGGFANTLSGGFAPAPAWHRWRTYVRPGRHCPGNKQESLLSLTFTFTSRRLCPGPHEVMLDKWAGPAETFCAWARTI